MSAAVEDIHSLGLAGNGSNRTLLNSCLCPAPVAKQQSDPQVPGPFSAISTLVQLGCLYPLRVPVPPFLGPFMGPATLLTLWKMHYVVPGWATPCTLCHALPPSLYS